MGHADAARDAGRFRHPRPLAKWRFWLKSGPGELGVAIVAGALGAGISLWCGLPVPSVHDEFSYLLAGETFASGSVTIPPHPFWAHFESFHILQQPSMSSKYPPGQGLLLATGWKLFGHPAAGAWLGAALSSAAICWMLRGSMAPRWAILGGAVSATHREVLGWTQTYEGAHVAIMGAAVLIGAVARMPGHRPVRNAALATVGGFLLFISRPFEGLILTITLAPWLLARAFRNPKHGRSLLSVRVCIAVMAIALPSGAMVGYHNARVTGHLARPPYVAYQDTYGHSPVLLWMAVGPVKEYRHDIMRSFYTGWEFDAYRALRTPAGFLNFAPYKLLRYLGAVFGSWLLLLPLFAPVWAARPSRFALVGIGAIFCAILAVPWLTPQYAAPAIPFGCLALASWIRAAGKGISRYGLSVAPVLTLVIGGCLANALGAAKDAASRTPTWAIQRAVIEQALERLGGKHLIFVRYDPGHSPHEEWVYNRPHIDRARVVWAREIQPTADRDLADSMTGRRAWRLNPDGHGGPRLTPY